MDPNQLSYAAVLAGQYHLSARKIQSLLKEQLGTTDDLVYEKILYSRSSHSAKVILGDEYFGVVVSDQCPSYNWQHYSTQNRLWYHLRCR